MSVNQLRDATGAELPTISQHLRALTQADLLTSRRVRAQLLYRPADPELYVWLDVADDLVGLLLKGATQKLEVEERSLRRSLELD